MNPSHSNTETSKRVTGNCVFDAERSDPPAGGRKPWSARRRQRRDQAMSARDREPETPIEFVAVLGEK